MDKKVEKVLESYGFKTCAHGFFKECEICGDPPEPFKDTAKNACNKLAADILECAEPRVLLPETSVGDIKHVKGAVFGSEPPKAESLQATLDARGNRYGEFAENALVAQQLKEVFRDAPKWHALASFQKEALDIIASKISRLLSGDPNYADNWHDIQGFAKLVEERLPK